MVTTAKTVLELSAQEYDANKDRDFEKEIDRCLNDKLWLKMNKRSGKLYGEPVATNWTVRLKNVTLGVEERERLIDMYTSKGEWESVIIKDDPNNIDTLVTFYV